MVVGRVADRNPARVNILTVNLENANFRNSVVTYIHVLSTLCTKAASSGNSILRDNKGSKCSKMRQRFSGKIALPMTEVFQVCSTVLRV